MPNSMHGLIENNIASIVLELSERSSEIDPDHVTDLITKDYDPENKTGIYMFYAARNHFRKMVGEYMARSFDPVKRLKDNIKSGDIDQMDAFSDELQDFYPVKRSNLGAKPSVKYINRYEMKTHECLIIGRRFKRAGGKLNKHGDNIIAFGIALGKPDSEHPEDEDKPA